MRIGSFSYPGSTSGSRIRRRTAKGMNFFKMIRINALLLLILDEVFMKSYQSIRFLTCIFVIFGRLTCKTPTSDFRDLFPVSKTHEKCASVRFLIRDPLREPIRPKFENFHFCNTLKNHWNFEKFQGCGSHLGVFRRAESFQKSHSFRVVLSFSALICAFLRV